ncbi:MAG: hypothetical protein ACQERD_04765 [Campylobacterota bacterium]
MIKKVVLISLFLILNANADLKTQLKNMLGEETFSMHENLINFIFTNEQRFYTQDRLNYYLVSQKLQENNLLNLEYPKQVNLDIKFEIIGNYKKALFILEDSLKSLGYFYYFTKSANTKSNLYLWNIDLKTQAAINPLRLSKLLAATNSKIIKIIKEGEYSYLYKIDFTNSLLPNANNMYYKNSIDLKKPFEPYFIRLDNRTNSLRVASKYGNRWHPYIVFYDRDFNILKILKDNKIYKNITLDVPDSAKYLKIDDLFSLSNLKRGIRIVKE